jgi:hypothetical protein
MALDRVWIPSPNYSSRGGAGVRLLVLHTAEGARTIESLGSYFQGNVQASSHVGADDKPGVIGEYVRRPDKAWTQGNFNPACVSIELCGFASWSTSEWRDNHPNMLANCAAWIAEEAAHYGIPIVRLSASQAQGSGRGVCQHVDLGAAGGGHHDCGTGFPMDYVLELAQGKAPEAKPPPQTIYIYPTGGDVATIAMTQNKDGRLEIAILKDDGTVKHIWQQQPNGKWIDGWATFPKP